MLDQYFFQRQAAVSIMEKLLGDRFLRYVLNLDDEEDIQHYLNDEHPEKIAPLFQTTLMGIQSSVYDSPVSAYHHLFCQCLDGDCSLATALRLDNSGATELPTLTEDQLLNEFSKELMAIFPALQLKATDKEPRFFWFASSISSLLFADFNNLTGCIYSEPGVQKLFESASLDYHNEIDKNRLLTWFNVGNSLNFQPFLIGTAILIDALFRASLETDVPTCRGIESKLSSTLNVFRKVLDGQIVEIPALIILSGLSSKDLSVTKLGCGVLRKPTVFEKEYILSSDFADATVIQTAFPLQLFAVGSSSDTPEGDPFSEFIWKEDQRNLTRGYEHLQNTSSLIRLSLLLASESEVATTIDCGVFISSPTGLSGQPIRTPELSKPGSHPKEIAIPSEEIAKWESLVKNSHLSELAIRRILSAFSERTEQTDAFVDLLIAIECILGVQSETTFKVSASIAKLIEKDDSEKRTSLFEEFKKLYDLRSRIVHGDPLDRYDLTGSLERLKQITIQTIKELLENQKNILGLPAEKRSKELILK